MTFRAAVLVASVLLVAACDGQLRFADNVVDGSTPPASACARDSDCHPGLYCDSVSGDCVECVDDSECTAPRPRCDGALHQCVACGVSSDCPMGMTCMQNDCVASCGDGGMCPASSPICDPARGICVVCLTNSDCASAPNGARVCDKNGQCVQCTVDAQCMAPTPRCYLATDVCVECLYKSDCAANRICSSSHTCIDE